MEATQSHTAPGREALLRDFESGGARSQAQPVSEVAMAAHQIHEELRSQPDLFSKPIHVGLDSNKFTEQQRNAILLHLELIGKKIGLMRQVVFPSNRKGRLAMFGDLDGDEQDARDKQRIWDRFMAAMSYYDELFKTVMDTILALESEINDRLAVLEEHIAAHKNAMIENKFGAASGADQHMAELEEERAMLKEQKQELKREKEKLKNERAMPRTEELEEAQTIVNNVREELSSRFSTWKEVWKRRKKPESEGAASKKDEDESEEAGIPLPPPLPIE